MNKQGRKIQIKAIFNKKIDDIVGLKATNTPRKVAVIPKKWFDEFVSWLNTKGEKFPPELNTKPLFGTNKIKPNLKRGVEYEIIDSKLWNDLTRNFGTTPKIEAVLIQNPKSKEEVILFQFSTFIIYLPRKRPAPSSTNSNGQYSISSLSTSYYSDPNWVLGDVKNQICETNNLDPNDFSFAPHNSSNPNDSLNNLSKMKDIYKRYKDGLDLKQNPISKKEKLPPIKDSSKGQVRNHLISKNGPSSLRPRQPSVPRIKRYSDQNDKKPIESKKIDPSTTDLYSTDSVKPKSRSPNFQSSLSTSTKGVLAQNIQQHQNTEHLKTMTDSSNNINNSDIHIESSSSSCSSSLSPTLINATVSSITTKTAQNVITTPNDHNTSFSNSYRESSNDLTRPLNNSNTCNILSPISSSSSNFPKPVGLNNLGNTCFFNAAVQCLARVMPLTNFILSSNFENQINLNNPKSSRGRIAHSYRSFLQDMCKGSSYGSRDPTDLRRSIVGKFKRFANYGQHDSQELLCSLLDGLHEDMNQSSYAKGREAPTSSNNDNNCDSWSVHKSRNSSPIVDIFHGVLYSSISCPECRNIEAVHDPFMFLSLDIPRRFKPVKLSECLSSFSQCETLDAKNKWKCEKCGKMVCATKEMGVDKCAQVLIIHLKRFSGEGYFASKIDTSVDYPDHLEASTFTKHDAGKFRLIGAVFHSGGLGGGHYTSAAVDPGSGDWYNFNDSMATKIDSNSAHKGSAYILFYQRD